MSDPELYGPAYWPSKLRQDEATFGRQLRQRIAELGLTRDDVADHLVADFEGLSRGQVHDWIKHGCWDPVVLYRLCAILDLSAWEAALAIGSLPENPEKWIERRMVAGTMFSLEQYLESKRVLHVHGDGSEAPARVVEIVSQLPDVQIVHMETLDRGHRYRRPYHSALVLRASTNGVSAQPSAKLTSELRKAIDRALAVSNVYVHWEPSAACKPVGYADDDVLIVENFFDNRPSPAETKAPSRSPIVVLGVYYSGAKDIGTMVSESIDFGVIDVTRYVAQTIQDSHPFRRELSLQGQVFWNILSDESMRQRMVVTIDDYEALTRYEVPVRRRWGLAQERLPGAVAFLKLSERMIDYAAVRINANSAGTNVGQTKSDLVKAQRVLEAIASRFQTQIMGGPIVVDNSVVAQSGAEDMVDEMFDTYAAIAARISEIALP